MRLPFTILLSSPAVLATSAAGPAPSAERALAFSRTAGFRHDSNPTAVATSRTLAMEAVYEDTNLRAQLRRGLRYAAGHSDDC
jgi:hypothetical protein